MGKGWASALHLSSALSIRSVGRRPVRTGRVLIITAWPRMQRRIISLGDPLAREELARAGGPPPWPWPVQLRYASGHALARDTLGPKRGAMQALSGVANRPARGMFAGTPRHLYAQDPARDTHRSSGTAPRVTPPSACCPTAWPRGCLGHSMGSKRSSSPPSRPRPAPRRCQCATPRCGA